MRVGPTDRGRALGAAGITLALAGLLLGFEDLTRVGLVAIVAVVAATCLVAFTTPRLEVDIRGADLPPLMSGHVTAVPIRVRADRRSRAVRLEQPLPESLGGEPVRRSIPALRAGRTLDLTLTLTPRLRGRHDIPPPTVIVDDPFGLAERSHAAAGSRSLLVLPRVHPLETVTVRGGRRPEGPTARVSPFPGEDPGSVRDYRPGDDLRHIHWAATAHRGALMTRQDETAPGRHALLVLDPYLADRAAPALLEWGIELLASAAVALEQAGLTVDLLTGPTDRPVGALSPALVPGTASRVEETLLTLATLPTTTRPPRLRSGGEDPFAESVRTRAARAGLVVLAAGVRDPGVRDLLLALPPGTAGLACLLSPIPVAPELVELARQAGWAAHACTSRTDHTRTWRDFVEGPS